MATRLQLQKKRDDAMAAVASAKNDKARAKALADLEVASMALASLQVTPISARTVKTVKKEERYEEEEDEDEEEDEEADEDESDEESGKGPKKPLAGKKASDKDDDDDSDDDDGDDDSDDDDDEDEDEDEDESEDEDEDADEGEDEDEDEEEDEKAAASAVRSARKLLAIAKRSGNPKALASARVHVRSVKRAVKPRAVSNYARLKAACARITGKKGLATMIGALDALKVTAGSTEKLATDVARIKAKSRREKVDAMLSDARRAGKVTKAQIAPLRSQGINDSKWLRSYLDTLPKQVRLSEEGGFQGKSFSGSGDADADRAQKLDAQNMSPEQRKFVEQAAMQAGKSVDDFVADMNKTNKLNGASRRGQ